MKVTKRRVPRWVYDYRIDIAPNPATDVTACTVYVYNKVDKDAALREFFAKDMKVVRKNGVWRGSKQFRDHLKITRLRSRLLGA